MEQKKKLWKNGQSFSFVSFSSAPGHFNYVSICFLVFLYNSQRIFKFNVFLRTCNFNLSSSLPIFSSYSLQYFFHLRHKSLAISIIDFFQIILWFFLSIFFFFFWRMKLRNILQVIKLNATSSRFHECKTIELFRR